MVKRPYTTLCTGALPGGDAYLYHSTWLHLLLWLSTSRGSHVYAGVTPSHRRNDTVRLYLVRAWHPSSAAGRKANSTYYLASLTSKMMGLPPVTPLSLSRSACSCSAGYKI